VFFNILNFAPLPFLNRRRLLCGELNFDNHGIIIDYSKSIFHDFIGIEIRSKTGRSNGHSLPIITANMNHTLKDCFYNDFYQWSFVSGSSED
jgi:hypothetical protein